jgi:hypothetical protein
MHKLITGTDGSTSIDHKNRKKHDNRLSNLRVASNQNNSRNVSSYNNKKSDFKGVSYHKQAKHWYSRIKVNGKPIRIGCFTDEIACANSYNYFAEKLFGEFAFLNEVPYMSLEEWCSYRTSTKSIERLLEETGIF